MLLLFLILYLKSSLALLSSTENRISTRNITCLHGLAPTTNFVSNCEACLITSRNYDIETTLSVTGNGLAGITNVCLQVNDIEIYHENLVRECRYFPQDTLNGYADFCIASPNNHVRGSYRACLCTTNYCNFNLTRCIRPLTGSYRDDTPVLFTNTISRLTNRVECYRSNEKLRQQTYSTPTPLCSDEDEACKNYVYDNAVLCMVGIDRTNQLTRQTLIPSIYSAYLLKYKNQLCKSFLSTEKSIYFSECGLQEAVCMCISNGCNKDLETCRTNGGIFHHYYSVLFMLLFVLY